MLFRSRSSAFLPVAGLFVGVADLVDGRFVEVLADDHQADRQPADEATIYKVGHAYEQSGDWKKG